MSTVAGIDEVGRGPLAGPVVAAVVVLHADQMVIGVRDSKAMTAEQRNAAAIRIRAEAVEWSLGEASREEVDRLNILQATLLAMRRAFAGLRCIPDRVEVDGNRPPELTDYGGILETVIGGDRDRVAIAAASILAKVYRDDLMTRLHLLYPHYGFDRHKGYPTREHRDALMAFGACPEHRRSFAPVRRVLELS
ncbi:MAG: ribonuclease HII [Gammaproteobacteria bacterium]